MFYTYRVDSAYILTMASEPIRIALNALDHLPPPNYPNAILYLALKSYARPEEVFEVLREGLHRTFVQLPWLAGKVHPVPLSSIPGVLEIRYYPVDFDGARPHQIRFNQLDSSMTYEELQESEFHPATFADEAVTWKPFLTDISHGTEVFVAQANFLPGGCILTAAICHSSSDGMGIASVLKIWGDNCRDVQRIKDGQLPQAPQKHPEEIYNRDLIEQTCTSNGSQKSLEQLPAKTWRLLGLEAPGDTKPGVTSSMPDANLPRRKRVMEPYIFYMSSQMVATLRDDCTKDLGGSTVNISINDAICALVWRCLIRARIAARAAMTFCIYPTNEKRDCIHSQARIDVQVRLDLPFDVRPHFPGSLPPNYLGNFTMINQALLPLSRLISTSTSIGSVASTIRCVADGVTSADLMDAYILAKTLPNLSPGPKLQNLTVDGDGLMITSLLAFPIAEVSFGDTLFSNCGRPETIRTLMGAINKVFRYCAILPRKSHGGVEFVANLFDTELEFLMEDAEFNKYAMFVI